MPDNLKGDETPPLDYALNTNTMRFHWPECESADQMKEKNREYYTGSREQLIEDGFVSCGK